MGVAVFNDILGEAAQPLSTGM